ncbi:unnamed protein product [Colias eurytheme]|nr:unnamed protein product [Colias eurytheme]
MDPQQSTSSQSLSPRKKRPRVALTVTEKLMVQNVYKHVFKEKVASLLPIETPGKNECVSKTADILGIGHAPKKAWIDQAVVSARQAFLDGLTSGLKQPSGKGRRKLETLPTMSWTKLNIQEWLTSKDIPYETTTVKASLIDSRQHKEQYYEKYDVDEMAAQYGIIVLCLPPYHCELNPIALKAYAAYKSYGELRLLHKITEEHINPEKINKTRVKAATLSSHSVAVTTKDLVARGDLPANHATRDKLPAELGAKRENDVVIFALQKLSMASKQCCDYANAMSALNIEEPLIKAIFI